MRNIEVWSLSDGGRPTAEVDDVTDEMRKELRHGLSECFWKQAKKDKFIYSQRFLRLLLDDTDFKLEQPESSAFPFLLNTTC